MILFAHRSPVQPGYRFVTRVTGIALPGASNVLRLRSTLSAADHTVVAIRTASIALDGRADFEELAELVHERVTGTPPKYFEFVASVSAGGIARAERRLAGIMDHAQAVIVLPPIAFEGRLP